MRFRSTCIYKRQENIKVDHSIIRSRPFTLQITIDALQFFRFNIRPWRLPRSSTASFARSLSGLVNRVFNVMAVSVGTIESVTLGYPLRLTVQQLMKELKSSGNASSANIPMLTAPWRTSPFLTHLQRKVP